MKIGSFKWLFGRNSEFWPTNMKTGMWAWVGHRLTGLVLVAYVFMHLSFITQASLSHEKFDSLMEIVEKPLFVLLDFVLVCAVIYHAMNGLRVVLFDMGIGIRRQKLIFWIMMAISVAIIVAGFWVLLDAGLFQGEWF